MYLIYGKGRVGLALTKLCLYLNLPFEHKDDNDDVDYSLYDHIIPSPGIPENHALYKTGKVVAELDFVSQFLPDTWQTIGITGTDGKSTTSWILYSILKRIYSGKKTIFLSGNFEIPFSETVLQILTSKINHGIIVLEISSFMAFALGRSPLEPFAPEYAIFTNFQKDHLNWHKDIQDYLDAKMNLILRATKKAIVNTQIVSYAQNHGLSLPRYNPRYFSLQHTGGTHISDVTDGEMIQVGSSFSAFISETNFSGKHNAQNILSVFIVLELLGLDLNECWDVLTKVQGLPHRLEKIAEYQGVQFIEDSKSTSAQSLAAALSAFGDKKNILLIVGGSDKGDSFDHLDILFEDRVKAVACIGDTGYQFHAMAIKMGIPAIMNNHFDEVIPWLFDLSSENDVLLLSPGCASFGLFRDYLDRAHRFREAVDRFIIKKSS